MALPTPTIPMVNLGYKDIQGLRVSFLSGTTLSIALGQVRDSTNTNDIVLSAAVTLNAATAAVVNGIDVGALANSTLYAVYAIGDSTGYNASGSLLSTSFTSPALPAGYDMARRIGAVRTSGAAAILDFNQDGNGVDRTVWYAAAILSPINGGVSTAFAQVDCTTTSLVPSTAGAIIFDVHFTAATAGDNVALRAQSSTSTAGQVIFSGDFVGANIRPMTCPATILAGIIGVDYKISAAGSVVINVAGYVDQL